MKIDLIVVSRGPQSSLLSVVTDLLLIKTSGSAHLQREQPNNHSLHQLLHDVEAKRLCVNQSPRCEEVWNSNGAETQC